MVRGGGLNNINLDRLKQEGFTNIIYSSFNSGETFIIANALLNLDDSERKKYKIVSTQEYNKNIFRLYNIEENFICGYLKGKRTIDAEAHNNRTFDDMPIVETICKICNFDKITIKKPIISENAKNNVEKFLEANGLKDKKLVFLSPESRSFGNLSLQETEFIIHTYTELGYSIVINSNSDYLKYLEGWKINNQVISTIFMNYEETYYLVSLCKIAVCVRSGLIDIIGGIDSCQFIILYRYAQNKSIKKFLLKNIYNRDFIELTGCDICLLRYIEDNNKIYKWR